MHRNSQLEASDSDDDNAAPWYQQNPKANTQMHKFKSSWNALDNDEESFDLDDFA